MRIEGERKLLADYLNNFSRDRENQTRDNNKNKSKLTLEDFQALTISRDAVITGTMTSV